MSLADGCAVILWVGVMLYALLGGADFGAGFWDLTAGGTERGRRPRALIDHAISPVWEANHVWLVFVLVTLWTAFPAAFAADLSTLFIPFTLAALGIVLRGASFAFRKVSARLGVERMWGAVFAVSSVLTPFFLGAALGGIASGRVPPGNEAGDIVTSWANPTSAMIGALAVASCAYLASVYLIADARRVGDADLERYFERRALGAGVVTGALAIGGIFVLRSDASYVYGRLVHEALPLVVLSGVFGVAVLALLFVRRHPFEGRLGTFGIRLLAAGAVAAVIWAWGVAQWPYLLPTTLTVSAGAGDDATLKWVLGVFGIALVTVIPSIGLLFYLDNRSRLEEDATGVLGSEPWSGGRLEGPTTGDSGHG
jgi:cytochrome d ubiquinol oxidase subunit II